MAGFRSLNRVLLRAEKAFLFAALAAMVLIVFLDFFGRILFNIGLFWAKELASYLMIWTGFVGASVVAHERRHLAVGLLGRFLPPVPLRISAAVAAAATGLICLSLGAVTFKFVLETRAFAENALTLPLPLWVVQGIMPLTFWTMALRFLGLGFLIARAEVPAAEDGVSH